MNKNSIEEETLRVLKGYELSCLLNNLKYQRLNDIKQEVFDRYQKSLLDLTEDEVKTLSINVRKEYRSLLNCLIWEFAKYSKPNVIYVQTLRDVHDELEKVKEQYYKKHPNEKK